MSRRQAVTQRANRFVLHNAQLKAQGWVGASTHASTQQAPPHPHLQGEAPPPPQRQGLGVPLGPPLRQHRTVLHLLRRQGRKLAGRGSQQRCSSRAQQSTKVQQPGAAVLVGARPRPCCHAPPPPGLHGSSPKPPSTGSLNCLNCQLSQHHLQPTCKRSILSFSASDCASVQLQGREGKLTGRLALRSPWHGGPLLIVHPPSQRHRPASPPPGAGAVCHGRTSAEAAHLPSFVSQLVSRWSHQHSWHTSRRCCAQKHLPCESV